MWEECKYEKEIIRIIIIIKIKTFDFNKAGIRNNIITTHISIHSRRRRWHGRLGVGGDSNRGIIVNKLAGEASFDQNTLEDVSGWNEGELEEEFDVNLR